MDNSKEETQNIDKTEYLKTFGKRIKIAMTRNKGTSNGISSQIDLANKLDATAASISGYINGKKAPSLLTLVKIAQELNVSTDWLLGVNLECPTLGVKKSLNAYDVARYLLAMESSPIGLDISALRFKNEALSEFFGKYNDYRDSLEKSGDAEKLNEMFSIWLEHEMQELKKIEI